jgi:hypothetical protein
VLRYKRANRLGVGYLFQDTGGKRFGFHTPQFCGLEFGAPIKSNGSRI